jgi:hypothetical protein
MEIRGRWREPELPTHLGQPRNESETEMSYCRVDVSAGYTSRYPHTQTGSGTPSEADREVVLRSTISPRLRELIDVHTYTLLRRRNLGIPRQSDLAVDAGAEDDEQHRAEELGGRLADPRAPARPAVRVERDLALIVDTVDGGSVVSIFVELAVRSLRPAGRARARGDRHRPGGGELHCGGAGHRVSTQRAGGLAGVGFAIGVSSFMMFRSQVEFKRCRGRGRVQWRTRAKPLFLFPLLTSSSASVLSTLRCLDDLPPYLVSPYDLNANKYSCFRSCFTRAAHAK